MGLATANNPFGTARTTGGWAPMRLEDQKVVYQDDDGILALEGCGKTQNQIC